MAAASKVFAIANSQRHPLNQFQRATIRIDVDGDTFAIADLFVDAEGRENRGSNTVRADGVERHVERRGYTMAATRRGSVLDTVAKKDGQIVGWGRYEISDDGRTLIVSGEQQRIVLGRGNPT